MSYKSVKSFAKAFQKAVSKETRAASVTSINRAIASTKTQAVKEVSTALGGKQKELRIRIGAFKATAARPKGAMITFSKPLSLSAFSPKTKTVKTSRGKRKAVTVTGPKGRYVVAAGSLAKFRSGKQQVFTRNSDKSVTNLTTTAVFKYLSQPSVVKSLENKASREFEKNFVYEMKRRKLT
jgi:hypothetical protein